MGNAYLGFVRTAVEQLLGKLNETETQRNLRAIKRESVSSDVSPVKSQKLSEDWIRASPPRPSSSSPPDPHSIQPHIADGTDTFILINIQRIMIDDSVTTHMHAQVDIGKLISIMRKNNYWQVRDKNPRLHLLPCILLTSSRLSYHPLSQHLRLGRLCHSLPSGDKCTHIPREEFLSSLATNFSWRKHVSSSQRWRAEEQANWMMKGARGIRFLGSWSLALCHSCCSFVGVWPYKDIPLWSRKGTDHDTLL